MEGDPLDLVGDLIDGQFRVDSFVDFGDLSLVYRGFHVGVEADIAIKFLDLPTTLDAALVEPLIRSFREGSKLHYRLARGHLHIAQCIGSGQTLAPRTGAVVPYLVREWLQGQSLRRDFAERRSHGLAGRSLLDTSELFRGALEALAYAHRQGVPHLALNPSNLFLARSGVEVRLKILDFGVAHAMNEHAAPLRAGKAKVAHQPGLRVLDPAYAAPEQLDAAIGQSGAWTDVYAMALLFIEALVDRPMFGEAPPTLDQAMRPAARPIAMPPNLDPRIGAVLSRALSFSPRERQPSAGIFLKELADLLPGRSANAGMRRASTAPKMPAMRRSQTLVGLQEMGGKPASIPPLAPKKPSAPPPPLPAKKASVPPPQTKVSTRSFPFEPFAGPSKQPQHLEIDDAPTAQEAEMRFPPPPPMPTALPVPAMSATARLPPSYVPPVSSSPVHASPPMAWPTSPPVQPGSPFELSPSYPSGETVVPPPFLVSPRKIGPIVVGVVAAGLLLGLLAWIFTRADSSPRLAQKSIPTASAAQQIPPPAIPPIPPTTPVATALPHTPDAAQTVAPVAPVPTTRRVSSGRQRFTIAAGRAALNDASKTLGDCKRPHGHTGAGSVRVTFSPDSGRVIHVQIGPPYSGTEQGRCIVTQFRAAQMDPFIGKPSAINYVFHFPR